MKHRLLTYAAGLIASGGAFAHHSGAAYDMARQVSFEGTVTVLSWTNPHVFITLATEGPDGAPLAQEIEAMSVSQARGLGLRREAISPGARVVVRAFPNRRGSGRAFGLDVKTSDGAVMPLSSFARFSVAPPPVVEQTGLAGRWAPTVESFGEAVAVWRSARLTEAGRAARQEVLNRYADPGAVRICEPLPPPLLHTFPDLRTIEVADGRVVIHSETNGVTQERVVRVDQEAHGDGLEPAVEGHSIGRWEGGSLLIDTVGFAASPIPDLLWLPTHPDTHLIERLTLTQDRRHVEYEFTLAVPAYLAEPATFRATWDHRPDLDPSGVACDPEVARRFLQGE